MEDNNENSTKTIDRLSQFVEFKHDNFNKLSLNIGVSNSYFSKMVRNNGSIGSEVLAKIVIYYDDLNINWLLTGEGDMLKSSPNILPSNLQSIPHDHTPGTPCLLCKEKDERIKEKDERIADLKESIENLKENIKSLGSSFKSVIETQLSMIQSLQNQIDDLQQQQFDDQQDVTSQAG